MQFKALNFSYNNIEIFKDFNFESNSSLILLMGSSGCGKTTFLKIIANVLDSSLSYEVRDFPEECYLVLQDDALCPWLTGIQNITRFLDIDVSSLEKIPLYLHSVSFINRKACNMSFGQRRMIELLRAIIYRPKLLLLDEPFNYLDSESRKIVSYELSRLIDTGSTKIILSNHYTEDFSFKNPDIYFFPEIKPISKLNNEKSI
jgi:ABC-type multidrug transport system ATPase subunit